MAVKDAEASNWALPTRSDNRKYSRVDVSAPSAPTITATVSGTTPESEIDLVITPGVDANSTVIGHNIYRSTSVGGTYSLVTATTGTTHTDANLTELTQYFYKATSVNAFGLESSLSTADDATTTSPQGSFIPWVTQDAVSYTPIVRNLRGPGVNTVAGSGRTLNVVHTEGQQVTPSRILRVNSLSSANSGSGDSGTFRYCIARHQSLGGPSTIVFEVGGTIDLTGLSVNCRGNLLTVAGQTAPTPGIQFINANSFVFLGSDILLQHFTVRVKNTTNVNANALYFQADATSGTSRRLVADHLTTMWGVDQVFSTFSGTNSANIEDLTIANTIIAEGIGTTADPAHKFNSLMGDRQGAWLLYGSLLANSRDRNPLSRAPQFAAVNNLLSNWEYCAIDMQAQDRGTWNLAPSHGAIVNNVFVRGVSTTNSNILRFQSSTRPLTAGSKVYVAGNKRFTSSGVDDTTVDQWDMVGNQSNAPGDVESGSATYWPTGLVAHNVNEVRAIVQAFVGARPGERDTETARLITEVGTNSGTMKAFGTVTHATYSSTALAFPASPPVGGNWYDITATGYTKLEDYLHELEDAVL